MPTCTATKWVRVTRHQPCPICTKPDWCGVSADGEVACCMRVQSDRPTRNGGWLHSIAGALPASMPCVYVPPARKDRRRATDWAAVLHRFERDTQKAEVERLARSLGVSADSLPRLGCAWAAPHRAWAFPMLDGQRAIIGLRLRAEDGRKWAIADSRNGLFFPVGLKSAGPLLVCEGPTDTAAMLDLGYDAIGRPSCTGAVEMVIQAVRTLRRRDVVVVADADGPGIDGADRLARALTEAGRRPKVIRPLQGKDARAWVQAGATRAVVDCAVANALYWRASGG